MGDNKTIIVILALLANIYMMIQLLVGDYVPIGWVRYLCFGAGLLTVLSIAKSSMAEEAILGLISLEDILALVPAIVLIVNVLAALAAVFFTFKALTGAGPQGLAGVLKSGVIVIALNIYYFYTEMFEG